MRHLLRFMLFDGPARNRQTAIQIQPDISITEPPQFVYGELVSLGDDEDLPLTWVLYVVADQPYGKQIDDPLWPDTNTLLFQVYVARHHEWDQFEMPQHFRAIFKGKLGGALSDSGWPNLN